MKHLLIFFILFIATSLGIAQQNFEWAFTTNQYDRCNDFSDGLAIVKIGFERGYINREGKIHIKPQFNIIDAYSEDVASAGFIDFKTMDAKSGYINRSGDFVIEPQFEVTSPFQEGFACVRLNKLWGYIDKSGKFAIRPKFESATIFSKGIAPVQYKEKWGVINTDGYFIIEPRLDYILAESEGYFCVNIRGKWGYIHKTGQLAIPPTYTYASSFSEGIAKVQKDDRFGFINKEGVFVIEPKFKMVYSFSHSLASAQADDGQWGYIDHSGSFVIKPQFEKAFEFSEQLARVKIDGKWGYITTEGEIAIAPQFDVAYDFREGLARVEKQGKKGFIRYTPPTNKELIIDQPKAKPLELTRREIKDGRIIKIQNTRFTLKFYDHNKIDGDIISVNYNGRWLLKGYTLTEKSMAIELELDPNIDENYLLLYADDLGRNPPCTAAISIDDNSEIEEVILNSDLNQCDIIYFEKK
jgi:hypothetical protein